MDDIKKLISYNSILSVGSLFPRRSVFVHASIVSSVKTTCYWSTVKICLHKSGLDIKKKNSDLLSLPK